MNGTGKTRTQRRLEKRQAIILLALALAVSLASFTLGVFVGKRGAERDLARKFQQTERVLVAEAPAETGGSAAPDAVTPGREEAAAPPEQVENETRLSFYDDLSREDVPLGSGINQEPEEPPATASSAAQTPGAPAAPASPADTTESAEMTGAAAEQPATAALEPTATAAEQPPKLPRPAVDGSHAVQIGSFSKAGDAIALKNRMLDKDYPAFVREADLGDKGLWYRVRIGPYADSETAGEVLRHLEKNEQLEGFVSRE